MQELPQNSRRYGMIKVARAHHGPQGAHLVGSDLEHNQLMNLVISTGEYQRNLNQDWYFEGKPLIEVSMTLSQWAEFISSPNTTGVPCTLDYFNGEKLWKLESVPHIDKIKQHQEEYQAHWKEDIQELRKVVVDLTKALDEKAGKKVQRELINKLDVLVRNFIPNEAFALSQFDEHIEKRVNQAKTEIANYLARYSENQPLPITVEPIKSIGVTSNDSELGQDQRED